jgi:hypothetical protein
MKIQDYRNDFYAFSGKASDLNRQLAFGAIALIWLFKQDVAGQPGQPTVPHELILPGILVASALVCDVLQYIIASLIWFCYYRWKEFRGATDDEDVGRHSGWLEVPIWLFFAAKLGSSIAAYYFLILFLFKKFGVLPVH